MMLANFVLIISLTSCFCSGNQSQKDASPSSTKPKLCSPTFAMEEFLQKIGFQDSDVAKYAALFKNHNIDVPELLLMNLPEIQALGVSPYGDAAKITSTSSQDTNQCQGRNPCRNGGICKDGYQCISCLCDPKSGFYGPQCNKPCHCKNGAQCTTTVTGFKCICAPGWTGDLCEEQWLSLELFRGLENKLEAQQEELSALKERVNSTESLLKKYKQELRKEIASVGFELVRTDKVFPKFTQFNLHQKTPLYVEKPPVTLPTNTRAIVISVFCNFWNAKGHAYLNFDVYQKGNEQRGKASIANTHYNVYANTFYYEIMVPWNSSLVDDIIFKVTSSYQTGGTSNWYQVKLVGYITV